MSTATRVDVSHTVQGMDELTPMGSADIVEVTQESIKRYCLEPKDLGISRSGRNSPTKSALLSHLCATKLDVSIGSKHFPVLERENSELVLTSLPLTCNATRKQVMKPGRMTLS